MLEIAAVLEALPVVGGEHDDGALRFESAIDSVEKFADPVIGVGDLAAVKLLGLFEDLRRYVLVVLSGNAVEARPGDIVVCLGAGTISAWANALPSRLAKGAA